MKYLDFLYLGKESIQSPAIHNDFLEIKKAHHSVPQPFDESYTYDTRGNRLTSLTDSYTYNDLNQLTDSTTHTYTYNADGNLIEEKNKITTESKKYYYNSENRLIGFEHYPNDVSPADIVANYKYAIHGRRLQKNVNATVTNFFWEGDNLALELYENLQPIRRYVYGVGKDDVEGYVELSEVTGGMFDQYKQGWYSFIKDQVGTIYKVCSDNAQQMIDTRTYDVFGNIVNQTGSSTDNLGFHSKYYDKESGLNYFYYRYYNPINGRFINEDPIGFNGGFNMYLFVDNDPVNEIDPLGLQYSPWGCYGRMMKQKKYMIKPIEDKWRLIFGEDECPAVKECKKRCRKAWDGYYADVNSRYAGQCTKWSLKFMVRFLSKLVKPFYFFLGEVYVKTIVCGVLCKDEKYVRAFNAL